MCNFPRFKSGDTVTFAHPNHAEVGDQQQCRELLTIGSGYLVDQVDTGEWHTDVYLCDFPGVSFNSVMFDRADDAHNEEVPDGQNV